ncbi:type II toxin-antitoxin system HicB family antitoxin [Botrimarina sp.]|uniref:type II toxin-antitoxin system HicB family antitoxin n=1 Tax=Botrimarina sp. TaxID=2795802 RepID=UPI0032ED06DE
MIRKTRTGYSVDVPDLPGCVSTGSTIEEAREMIAEAIAGHIEVTRQAGESVPSPSSSVEFAIDENADEELCTWVDVQPEEAATPV